jgi:hypothetical protein
MSVFTEIILAIIQVVLSMIWMFIRHTLWLISQVLTIMIMLPIYAIYVGNRNVLLLYILEPLGVWVFLAGLWFNGKIIDNYINSDVKVTLFIILTILLLSVTAISKFLKDYELRIEGARVLSMDAITLMQLNWDKSKYKP